MVKNNSLKSAKENKSKLAGASEQFGVVELSTKKSSGKSKSTYVCNHTEVKNKVKNRPLSVVEDYAEFDFRANKKAKAASAAAVSVKKVEAKPEASDELEGGASLEELISLFEEFLAPVYSSGTEKTVKKAEKKPETEVEFEGGASLEELISLFESFTATVNSSKAAKASESKKKTVQKKSKSNAEPKELVVKEKNSEGTIRLKLSTDLDRKKSAIAEASERIFMDEAAERVVNTARMGALFDYYVQNY